MGFCGLDFGTSNSTLGTFRDNHLGLVALEGESTTLPSAIFFDGKDDDALIGRAAYAAYIGGADGRLMRSLKSILGTDLIDLDTQIERKRVGFRTILRGFLAALKTRAEEAAGQPLDSVVHGRPVHFVDGNPDGDRKAEAVLSEIAESIGFRHVSFQFEPIAAALDYERQVNAEEIALIADIGGGTSDFSIVRLGPERRTRPDRLGDILANDGIRLGGTDFDRLLSLAAFMPLLGYQSTMKKPGLSMPNSYYTDLSTWSKINFLYTPSVRNDLVALRRGSAAPQLLDRLLHVLDEHYGHRLASEVERAKIGQSSGDAVTIPLGWIEDALTCTVTPAQFDAATESLASRVAASITACVADAGLTLGQIDAVFLTGGSTLLPNVRRAILGALPGVRVVDGDRFGSVGLGLTLEAGLRYS